MDKDTKKLVKALEDNGYEVRMRSSGHATVFAPSGDYVTGLAGSPSERKGWSNVLSRIKRVGGHVYADGKLIPVEG